MKTLPRAERANISFVTSQLAVGGDISLDPELGREQLDELLELGVTHVVDVRQEWNDAELFRTHAPHVAYLHHGMDDAGQEVPAQWFDRGVTWCLEALQDPKARVLTHCHMGINRGPSLGFAVLLGLGWDPVEALDAVRQARPVAAAAYAEDALRWHHRQTGATHAEQTTDGDRLAEWREQHPLDVVRIIREVRDEERALHQRLLDR